MHFPKNNLQILVVIVIISIPLLIPYFHKGYFPTHDGEWAVVRLADMYRTVVQDHQIPARYSGYLNAGYGYPLFNFAYPFPYYLGLIPLVFNAGFVTSIKILFALSIPISAFAMYLFSRKLWNSETSGLISASIYLYAPYRMVDLFVRGSLGESLSFVLFPLLLLLSIKITESKKSVGPVVLFSILLALLIGTHNIMTVLFMPTLLVFSISYVFFKNNYAWRPMLLAFVLGIGLSAFFWLPALVEKQFIWLAETPIANRDLYFVTLRQMLIPRWGYGPPTESDGFSYQIGIFQIIILVFSLFLSLNYFLNRKRMVKVYPSYTGLSRLVGIKQFRGFSSTKGISEKISNILTCLVFLFVFLMTPLSKLFWEITPLFKEINYPWTMLSQIILIAAILSGFISTLSKYAEFIVIFGILVSILLMLPYAKPSEYINRGDDFYITNDGVTTSSNEYLPLWVKSKPLSRSAEKVEISNGKITDIYSKSNMITFKVDADLDSNVTINTTYYPGWEVSIENIVVPVTYNNEHGVIEFPVTSGKHKVEAELKNTPLRSASNFISLISMILIVIILIVKPFRRRLQILLYPSYSILQLFLKKNVAKSV